MSKRCRATVSEGYLVKLMSEVVALRKETAALRERQGRGRQLARKARDARERLQPHNEAPPARRHEDQM